MARYKPKQLAKQRSLLKETLDALCALACEPEPEGLDAEENAACKLAAQALDTVALNVASQHVLPQIAAFATAAAASGAPCERKAAMTVLAVVAEGCADALRRRLKSVVPLLLGGLRDGDVGARPCLRALFFFHAAPRPRPPAFRLPDLLC